MTGGPTRRRKEQIRPDKLGDTGKHEEGPPFFGLSLEPSGIIFEYISGTSHNFIHKNDSKSSRGDSLFFESSRVRRRKHFSSMKTL